MEKKDASKRPLRIAMLGHKRIPSREGGIEVVVGELSTRMARLGHWVTCYNRKGHHIGGKEFNQPELDSYNGVRLRWVFTINRRGWAAMTASVSAAIHAAFGRFDVVHFHAEGPCAMIWLPKLLGKSCVATIHGLDHMRAKWGLLPRLYIMIGEKMAVRFADEIIVLSKDAAEYFRKNYNRDTLLIPNGVNRPVTKRAELIRDLGLEADGYILFVGRLVPEKGIDYLIDAYKGLRTDKKLVIVGGSSDTYDYVLHLRDRVRDEPNILLTGFLQGKILQELYSNAYIYVQPSDLEGMPIALLEAMSYGNCCIVSDIPECMDVVMEHGVPFEHGNSESLRDRLQELCDDETKVRRSKEGNSEYICSRYDWDSIVLQTLDVYRKAMEK